VSNKSLVYGEDYRRMNKMLGGEDNGLIEWVCMEEMIKKSNPCHNNECKTWRRMAKEG